MDYLELELCMVLSHHVGGYLESNPGPLEQPVPSLYSLSVSDFKERKHKSQSENPQLVKRLVHAHTKVDIYYLVIFIP